MDFAFRRHGHFRQYHHAVHALVFDGGNDGDIHLTGTQRFGAKRRHCKRKFIAAAQRSIGETPDERRRIQEFDNRDAQFSHGLFVRQKRRDHHAFWRATTFRVRAEPVGWSAMRVPSMRGDAAPAADLSACHEDAA